MGVGSEEGSLIALAEKKLDIARHIIDLVFPSLKNPRLLLSAMENMFLSMNYAMNAVLEQELRNGMIRDYHQNFMDRYTAFRMDCMRRLKFDKSATEKLLAFRTILLDHKESAVEFSRNGKLVICDESYGMNVISHTALKKDLSLVQGFFEKAKDVLGGERLFKKRTLA